MFHTETISGGQFTVNGLSAVSIAIPRVDGYVPFASSLNILTGSTGSSSVMYYFRNDDNNWTIRFLNVLSTSATVKYNDFVVYYLKQ